MATEKRTKEGYSNKLGYIREYTKATYDRINLYVPKGAREDYKNKANSRGMSVTALFVAAVDEYIQRHPV